MSDERPNSLAAQAASWVPPWERAAREPDRNYQAAETALPDDTDSAAETNASAETIASAKIDASAETDGFGDTDGSAETDVSAEIGVRTEQDFHAETGISPQAGLSAGTARSGEAVASPSASQTQPDDPDGRPDPGDQESGAGLADDDDDFDESFEGGNPPGYGTDTAPELDPVPGEAGGESTVDAPQELPGEDEPDPTDLGAGPEVPIPAAIEDAVQHDDEGGVTVDAPVPLDGDDAGDVFDAAADDDISDDGEMDMPFAEEAPTEDIPDEDDDELPDDDAPGGDEDAPGEDPDRGAPDEDAPDGDGDAADQDSDDDAAEDAGTDPPVEAVPVDAPVDSAGERTEAPATAAGASGEPAPHPGTGTETATAAGAAADAGSGTPARRGGRAAGRHRGVQSSIPAQARGTAVPRNAVGPLAERTEIDDLEETAPALIEDGELRAALESILLVVDEPVAEMQLAQIMEQPTERVATMLEDISARFTAAGHGFDLRRAAGGWRLYTRPEYAPYVERFVLDGQSVRLTQAALETLAVVAYKQPVTRSRISAIRGVNCDGVMRTLATRGLIEECGTEGETGAHLYRTTPLFLEKLGLNSVDQLPPLAPFLPDDVEEVLDASG